MPSYDGPITKLPLFSKVEGLGKLPDQDPSAHYAVVSRLEPRPKGDDGYGYLVELLGGRSVRVLAWIGAGGKAFACDVPTAEPFECDPTVSLALDPDKPGRGVSFLRPNDGDEPTVLARFVQREGDGKVALSGAVRDLGSYDGEFNDLDTALSVLFLACYHLPLQHGEDLVSRTVEEVLNGLLGASYPDALDALMYRGTTGENGQEPSAFEHYAARSLERAGAGRVRAIAAAHDIELRRLGGTRMFWTAFRSSELEAEERDTLLAVEAALNRLALAAKACEEGRGAPARVNDLDEDGWERAVLATLADFVHAAPACLRACDEDNPFMKLRGVAAARGGEWDVRTRFAAAIEFLQLPFRLEYRFDCDARNGLLAIDCVLPAASAFPQTDAVAQERVRAAYAVRLSALLAAVTFGSGVGIVNALVTCRAEALDGPVLTSMLFGRQRFVMGAMPHIDSRDFTDQETPAENLLAYLGCEQANLSLSPEGALTPVEPIALVMPERSISAAQDTRPLPADLAERLCADTAADLDVYGRDDDTLADRFEEARQAIESGDAASAAGMLQDIVDTYDAASALQGDSRRPLYCYNMVERILVGRASKPGERFRKLPDSAYEARYLLARIYRDAGKWELAEQVARDLIGMAPTASGSHHALSMVFIAQDRYADAVEPLVDALRFAFDPNDIATMYYRLAFALWYAGDAKTGLACYTMVPPQSQFGDSAAEEAGDLMRGEGISRKPSYDEAKAQLRSAGIPIAPLDQVREDVLCVTTRLVDEGFFNVAASLVHFLSRMEMGPNGADVLAVVASSLR